MPRCRYRADLRELVAARVRTLPETVRAALLLASATPHPTTTLLDLDDRSLQPAIDAEIVRVALNGRIQFAHPLYASAIYEFEPIASRRMLHRRLAELTAAEDDEHSRHLALASSPPDEEVAQALERGAARARQRGAWQFAAELLEHARAFTPPGTEPATNRAAALRQRSTTHMPGIGSGRPHCWKSC